MKSMTSKEASSTMGECSSQGAIWQKVMKEFCCQQSGVSFTGAWPTKKQRCLERNVCTRQTPRAVESWLQPGGNQKQVRCLFFVQCTMGRIAAACAKPCLTDLEHNTVRLWKDRGREGRSICGWKWCSLMGG